MDKKKIYFLVLCITKKCNMDCEYCYVNGNKDEVMSDEVMKKAIDFGFNMADILQIQITGGEPFLYFRGIEKILNLLKEKGRFILQVQTNGTVISPQILSFIKTENIAVGVSFDGHSNSCSLSRKMNESKESSFKYLARNLLAFAEYGIKVGITCVVTSKNIGFLDSLIDLIYPLGSIYSLHLSVVRETGKAKGKDHLLPNPLCYEKQLKKLIQKSRDYGKWNRRIGSNIEFRFIEKIKKNIEKPDPFIHCHIIRRTGCYVEPNGDLYPCSSFSDDADFYIGNIARGIDEDKFCSIEDKFKVVMDNCYQCDDLNNCGGACFARAYYNNSKPVYECIDCKLAKEFISGELVYG